VTGGRKASRRAAPRGPPLPSQHASTLILTVTAAATPEAGRRPGRLRLLGSLCLLPAVAALAWLVALAIEGLLGLDSAAFENLTFWIALAVPASSTYRNARGRAVQPRAAGILVLATLLWTALLLLLVIVFTSPGG
jgi:hypothetical protein